MRRYILIVAVSGSLMLGGSLVLAEAPKPSGEHLAKLQTQVEQEHTAPTFEERLSLKPLSDEELALISAAGVGPVVYMVPPWVYTPNLLRPHIFNRRGTSFKFSFSRQ